MKLQIFQRMHQLILLIKAAYKMDYYIFHIFLLITTRLLLLIKHWLKQKDILPYSKYKMENNELKKIDIENRTLL